jgi:hypothetical protein
MIKTLNFTPTQVRTVYDIIVEKKHQIEDLLEFMKKDSQTKNNDLIHVMDYEITLKLIVSQLEKKL